MNILKRLFWLHVGNRWRQSNMGAGGSVRSLLQNSRRTGNLDLGDVRGERLNMAEFEPPLEDQNDWILRDKNVRDSVGILAGLTNQTLCQEWDPGSISNVVGLKCVWWILTWLTSNQCFQVESESVTIALFIGVKWSQRHGGDGLLDFKVKPASISGYWFRGRSLSMGEFKVWHQYLS